jgi:hemerythrin
MPISWNPALAVGVPVIDQEHQALFGHVNALLDAMHQGRGGQETGRLLGFLTEYTIHHFRADEQLMVRHRCPGLVDQRRQHQEFIGRLDTLKARLEAEGPGGDLPIAVNRLVCGWLRQHIGDADAALGRYLPAAGAAEAVEPPPAETAHR